MSAKVVLAMRTITEIQDTLLDAVWPQGGNPNAPWDGRHFTLKGFQRPVSVSSGEAFILAGCVAMSQPSLILEIGTGFGYSSAWLALGFVHADLEGRIISIDNYSEGGLGPAGLNAAKSIAKSLKVEQLVDFVVGESPKDVAEYIADEIVDIAFIDADHHADNPIHDYYAIREHLAASSLLLFHDVDHSRYTVHKAVELAQRDGWTSHTLNTSCHLTLLFKEPSWLSIAEIALRCAQRGVVASDPSQLNVSDDDRS